MTGSADPSSRPQRRPQPARSAKNSVGEPARPKSRGLVSLCKRLWPVGKYVLGAGLGIYAVYLVFGSSAELQGITRSLNHLKWSWVILAALAEVASFVSYAAMQRVLVRAGGVDISLRSLSWIAFVSTTMTSSMPAGPVVATAFVFRQFRRRGADEALAGWAAAASIVAASVGLAILAAVGVAIAGDQGEDLDLVWVTVGVLWVMLLLGTLIVQRRWLVSVMSLALELSQRLFKWPKGDLAEKMDSILAEINLVSPTAVQLSAATAFSVLNWLFDCSCLVFAFLALGVGIPWAVLLLAYGASQLAASLPITPGGLGVVDGSLSIGLVAYGGDQVSTVAVVLLYRVLSFWAQLPIGWGIWGFMAWRAKASDAAEAQPIDDLSLELATSNSSPLLASGRLEQEDGP